MIVFQYKANVNNQFTDLQCIQTDLIYPIVLNFNEIMNCMNETVLSPDFLLALLLESQLHCHSIFTTFLIMLDLFNHGNFLVILTASTGKREG
jgi:hypothetical protein